MLQKLFMYVVVPFVIFSTPLLAHSLGMNEQASRATFFLLPMVVGLVKAWTYGTSVVKTIHPIQSQTA